MNSNLKSLGNFIFDMILLNLVVLCVSVITLGVFFLPLILVAAIELNQVYFLGNSTGAFVSTFKQIKNKIVPVVINSIVHLLVIGLIVLVSINFLSDFRVAQILINSLIISFELSFWIIYFTKEINLKRTYKLSFIAAVKFFIIGLLVNLSSIVLLYYFFSGAFYLLLFLPLGFILVFIILYDKLIDKLIFNLGGNNEKL